MFPFWNAEEECLLVDDESSRAFSIAPNGDVNLPEPYFLIKGYNRSNSS